MSRVKGHWREVDGKRVWVEEHNRASGSDSGSSSATSSVGLADRIPNNPQNGSSNENGIHPRTATITNESWEKIREAKIAELDGELDRVDDAINKIYYDSGNSSLLPHSRRHLRSQIREDRAKLEHQMQLLEKAQTLHSAYKAAGLADLAEQERHEIAVLEWSVSKREAELTVLEAGQESLEELHKTANQRLEETTDLVALREQRHQLILKRSSLKWS